MDNNPATQSILDTLRTVEFRLGLKGYNVDEVDEYLEKAAVEAESVREQLRTVNDRLRQATERIGQLEGELQQAPAAAAQHRPGDAPAGPTPAGDETLQRTLMLAQKFVDELKRESEAEAEQVVAKAEERGRTMVAQAEEHARRVTDEADQRLRDEVARLESTRTRLAGEVDAMSKHLEEQRARIRESLTEALRWVDQHVQPTGASQAGPGNEAPGGGAAPPASNRDSASRGQAAPSGAPGSPMPSQPKPMSDRVATQQGTEAPSPDTTQVLPMTPPVADRATASAVAPYGSAGTTGNLFEHRQRME